MHCAQAGLEDFAYMEGVVDETQLKAQIVVTGAEVHSFSLLQYVMYPSVINTSLVQAGLNNCVWADSFAIGVVARWTTQ